MATSKLWALGIWGPLLLLLAPISESTELAPVAYIPLELRHLFHPDELLEAYEHPGLVQRGRRASGMDDDDVEGYLYTVQALGGADCVLVKTECTFLLNYRTTRYGMRTSRIKLPKSPEISGSCLRDNGDTSVLTMTWSVFNFSLIFTQNPEGNSYYLNKALLKFNQSESLFPGAAYKGLVILQTQRTHNYFFTPLGKSYECEQGEDQGPIDMYNVDDEVMGNMTLWNTRFQPFVKRAKGKWGEPVKCLPRDIQTMRADVVPFVVSGVFLSACLILVAGYALYRKFYVKKTDYNVYGPGGVDSSGGGERMESHEMKVQSNGTISLATGQESFNTNGHTEEIETALPNPAEDPAAAAPASNPFKNKGGASNPFSQNYGAAP